MSITGLIELKPLLVLLSPGIKLNITFFNLIKKSPIEVDFEAISFKALIINDKLDTNDAAPINNTLNIVEVIGLIVLTTVSIPSLSFLNIVKNPVITFFNLSNPSSVGINAFVKFSNDLVASSNDPVIEFEDPFPNTSPKA